TKIGIVPWTHGFEGTCSTYTRAQWGSPIGVRVAVAESPCQKWHAVESSLMFRSKKARPTRSIRSFRPDSRTRSGIGCGGELATLTTASATLVPAEAKQSKTKN